MIEYTGDYMVPVEWFGDTRAVSMHQAGDELIVVRHNPHGGGRDVVRRFAVADVAVAREYAQKWAQWADDCND